MSIEDKVEDLLDKLVARDAAKRKSERSKPPSKSLHESDDDLLQAIAGLRDDIQSLRDTIKDRPTNMEVIRDKGGKIRGASFQ